MTTVLLIRHASHGLLGKTLCGRAPDVSLSPEGRREAAALAERLAPRGTLAAVYASPQPRARETAEFIAGACGASSRIDDDLDEIDFGAWTGAEFAQLDPDPKWRRWNADRGRTRAPGGESLLDAQIRMARFLANTAERHAGAAVAAVSHADVIKAALAFALGLPLHFYDRFEIAPASVSVVRVRGEGLTVEGVNGTWP